jgi:xylan 1,4-beta-xylosidase
MGTLVIEQDEKLYSFLNADRIFDFLVSIGMKAVRPSCRSCRERSRRATRPSSRTRRTSRHRGILQGWNDLIDRLVRHWVDRFGIEEVATWPLEVWNEPNLEAFWTGGKDGYLSLYDQTGAHDQGDRRAPPSRWTGHCEERMDSRSS